MTLTKAQIVEAIAEQTGYPKNKSSEMVETILEHIKKSFLNQVKMFWSVALVSSV